MGVGVCGGRGQVEVGLWVSRRWEWSRAGLGATIQGGGLCVGA